MMKIVVVSPHPDDETLGAGGLISKYKKRGDQVYWINVTNVKDGQGWSSSFVEKRQTQIKQVLDFYKFDGFCDLKLRPSTLDSIDKGELIRLFSSCIEEIQPEIVILPNPEDAHTDHRVTYEAMMSCTKVFRYPSIRKILVMEILSETDFSKSGEAFSPNYYVDISDCINDKINAMKIYDTEIGEPPFPRNVEAVKALALLRGGTSGCHYAEAFRIIKEIER